MKKIDAFSHWTSNQISSLVMHVEEYKYNRNKVILKEGETPYLFYFIKSGEIELRKNVSLPEDERSEILHTLEDKDKFSRNQSHKPKKQDSIRVCIHILLTINLKRLEKLFKEITLVFQIHLKRNLPTSQQLLLQLKSL